MTYADLLERHALSRFLNPEHIRPHLDNDDVRAWIDYTAADGELEHALRDVCSRLNDGQRLRLLNTAMLQYEAVLRPAIFQACAESVSRDAYALQIEREEEERGRSIAMDQIREEAERRSRA